MFLDYEYKIQYLFARAQRTQSESNASLKSMKAKKLAYHKKKENETTCGRSLKMMHANLHSHILKKLHVRIKKKIRSHQEVAQN